ncbi:MAG: hypothetical protein ABMA64_09495 [Myxococcota bacterium]
MYELVRLFGSVGLLVAVPVAIWPSLRTRRGAIPITVGCVVGYLVLGNLLSQVVLLDVIYPADPWSGDHSEAELQQLLLVHSAVSLGAAAAVTVAVAAGLGRVLQRA